MAILLNMGNHRLEVVEEEKDLGVLINRTLSVSNNCAVAVKKANQMAGHIYRTVTHKSIQTVVPLYKALVRPGRGETTSAVRTHWSGHHI